MDRPSLEVAITEHLRESPELDARRLLTDLQRAGWTDLDKRGINSALYSLERAGRLRKDKAAPPRWRLAPETTTRDRVATTEPAQERAAPTAVPTPAGPATPPPPTADRIELDVAALPGELRATADALLARAAEPRGERVPAGRRTTGTWFDTLDDVTSAVLDEISATRETLEDSKVSLQSATVIGSTERGFTARFDLQSDIAGVDGARVEFGLPGATPRDAEIVGVSGSTITLWIEGGVPTDFTGAWMRQDASFLLKLRLQFLRDLRAGEAVLDATSALAALAPGTGALQDDAWVPPPALGERQVQFIRQALRPQVSWLWGPPGTGKTTTLAHLLAEFAVRDLRVLFVSNTNAAVDTAMLRYLEVAADRRVGEVVRLGEPSVDRLRDWRVPVTVDRIAESRNQEAGAHLVETNRRMHTLRKRRATLDVILRDPMTARDRGLIGRPDSDAFDLARIISGRDLEGERRRIERELGALTDRRKSLVQLLDLIRDSIAWSARTVFATVHRTYMSTLRSQRFDVVVIDEASMVSADLAMIAAGYASGHVVLAGDFRQLGPIALAESQSAHRWLRVSPFAASGVARAVKFARPTPNLVALDVQHRMRPSINDLISDRFYGEVGLATADSVRMRPAELPTDLAGELVLVDTSALRPWMTKRNGRWSRLNVMHAQIVDAVVSRARSGRTVGAVAPFAPQAALLRSLVDPRGDGYAAATVHRFQGGERNLIVWDMTEGRAGGRRINTWFSATTSDDEGARLMNVALSRAQDQLVVVADLARVAEACDEHAVVRRVLDDVRRRGTVIPASQVLADARGSTQLRRGSAADHPIAAVCAEGTTWVSIWTSAPPRRVSPELREVMGRLGAAGVKPYLRCGIPGYAREHEAVAELQDLGCSVQFVRPLWENAVVSDSAVVTSGATLLDPADGQEWVITKDSAFAGTVRRLLRRSGDVDLDSGAVDQRCAAGHPVLLDHGYQQDFRGRCVVCEPERAGATRTGRRNAARSARGAALCGSCGEGFDPISARCGC